MQTKLEQRFFKAFELGGVAELCLSLTIDKINGETINAKECRKAIEATENFDFSIINSGRKSPIIEEIETNLRELVGRQRENYLYDLIIPFRDWIRLVKGNPRKGEFGWSLENVKQIATQLDGICGNGDKASIESAFQEWDNALRKYSERLDALLLQEGEDLLKLQQTVGVKLIDYRDISALEYYCGTVELAEKYIAELRPTINAAISPIGTEAECEGWKLPTGLDTERARKYFMKAIDARFIRPVDNGFEWIRPTSKGEGKNTLIALFFGMVYCGDTILQSRYGDKWCLGDGIFPDAELKELFGVKSLGAIRTNGLDSSRQKSAPRGWRNIADLFK